MNKLIKIVTTASRLLYPEYFVAEQFNEMAAEEERRRREVAEAEAKRRTRK